MSDKCSDAVDAAWGDPRYRLVFSDPRRPRAGLAPGGRWLRFNLLGDQAQLPGQGDEIFARQVDEDFVLAFDQPQADELQVAFAAEAKVDFLRGDVGDHASFASNHEPHPRDDAAFSAAAQDGSERP